MESTPSTPNLAVGTDAGAAACQPSYSANADFVPLAVPRSLLSIGSIDIFHEWNTEDAII